MPRDLVTRLDQARAAENAELAVAASGDQTHPVVGLWNVRLRDDLRQALVVEGTRSVSRWAARYKLVTVTWPLTPVDPFFNANTVEDLTEADRLAARDRRLCRRQR